MYKFEFSDLVIEVTQKCNMHCAHCLRGHGHNKDIDMKYVDKLLRNTSCISSLTFTGGEPSLNLDAIRKTRLLCEKYNISVGSFYLVTNGKDITMDFINEMLLWYAFCDYPDEPIGGVALSKDNFHEPIPEKNEKLLRALSFFTEDKITDFEEISLVNLGNAKSLPAHYKKHTPWFPDVDVEIAHYKDTSVISVNSTVTLNCDGIMLRGCDYEFDHIDDITIGCVSNIKTLKSNFSKIAS